MTHTTCHRHLGLRQTRRWRGRPGTQECAKVARFKTRGQQLKFEIVWSQYCAQLEAALAHS